MFDLIARFFSHPIDYSQVWRTTDLAFKEKRLENDNVYSFIFTADRLPRWHAGQHAIFTLPGKKIAGKIWRPFSVASAPEENAIRIGTIIPPEPSSFKQQLMSLAAGEKIRMHGPFGEMYLRPEIKKAVAIAGGIGVTPFRSIIASLAHGRNNLPFHFIYSASGAHTYRDELETWAASLPNLHMTYTATPEEVNAELEKQIAIHGNSAHYLISGAPGMIRAIRETLSNHGIKKNHILNDPFKGY